MVGSGVVAGYIAGTKDAAVSAAAAMVEEFAAAVAAASMLAGAAAAVAVGTGSMYSGAAGRKAKTVVAARMWKKAVEAAVARTRHTVVAGAAGSGSWAAGRAATAGMEADLAALAALELVVLRWHCVPTARPRWIVVVADWGRTPSSARHRPQTMMDAVAGEGGSVLLAKTDKNCRCCYMTGTAARAVVRGCGVQTKRHCVAAVRYPLVAVVAAAVVADAAVQQLLAARAREDTTARPAPAAAEGLVEGAGMRPALLRVLLVGSGGR